MAKRKGPNRSNRTGWCPGPATDAALGLRDAHSSPPSLSFLRAVSQDSSLKRILVKTSFDVSQPPQQGALLSKEPMFSLLGRDGNTERGSAIRGDLPGLQPLPPQLLSAGLVAPYPASSQAPGPDSSQSRGSSAPPLVAPAGLFPQVVTCPAQAAPPPVTAC